MLLLLLLEVVARLGLGRRARRSRAAIVQEVEVWGERGARARGLGRTSATARIEVHACEGKAAAKGNVRAM